MREIKFRAWDKDLKVIRTVVNMEWINGVVESLVVRDGKQVPIRLNVSEIILIQFTGLKDKNGKEIYEGDIVAAPDGDWEVQIRDLEDGVVLNNDVRKKSSLSHIDGDYSLTECFVIGNIYEHPELLKTN
jgi:uncharacterized phage protein (TIGR01671 family)